VAEAAPVAVTTSNPVLVSHRAALFCVELSAQATSATRRLSVAPIDRLVASAPNVGIAGSATVRLESEGVFGRGHWELSGLRTTDPGIQGTGERSRWAGLPPYSGPPTRPGRCPATAGSRARTRPRATSRPWARARCW